MSPLGPAADHREVRLSLKVLTEPTLARDTMVANMRQVYAPHGIDVVVVPPVETLQLPVLEDLTVGSCAIGTALSEQRDLFKHRDGAGPADICVYFVRTTTRPLSGCASCAYAAGFPSGRPAVVVASAASDWTLAHECGHVLGLAHVDDSERLMTGDGTWNVTVEPPVLDAGEVEAIRNSPFVHPPPPGAPAPAPAPAPQAFAAALPAGGADALRSALDKDDDVDYDALARSLGPSALEALAELLQDPEPRIAASAAYLAGMIEGGSGHTVVSAAAESEHPVVRVAAAATLPALPEEHATGIAERVLEDDDVGVRGRAVRSAAEVGARPLAERIQLMADEDPSQAIRELAARLLGEGHAGES